MVTLSILVPRNLEKEVLNMLGIVLAGGQSKRFGRDKAQVQLPGQPLNNVGLAVTKLQLLCEQVIVSASQQNVANLTEQFRTSSNVIVVTDQIPFERQGPLSGIFAATNYSPELTDYLLLAVDYPLITTTILTTLVTQTDCYATTPTQDHYLVSHVQASQDMVRAHLLLGDLRVSHFIKTTCQGLPVTFPDSQAFTNLNNMEALTNAK